MLVHLAEDEVVAHHQGYGSVVMQQRAPGGRVTGKAKPLAAAVQPPGAAQHQVEDEQGYYGEQDPAPRPPAGRGMDGVRLRAGTGDQAVLPLGYGQADRLAATRSGIVVVELLAQPVNVHPHGGILSDVKTDPAAKYRFGHFDLLGRRAFARPFQEKIEQAIDGVGSTERIGGAQALCLDVQVVGPVGHPRSRLVVTFQNLPRPGAKAIIDKTFVTNQPKRFSVLERYPTKGLKQS